MGWAKALRSLERLRPQKLAQGRYDDPMKGCGCAVGAISLTARGQLPKIRNHSSISTIEKRHPVLLSRIVRETGLSPGELEELQDFNDQCAVPKARAERSRYKRVLTFVRNKARAEQTATR
jgi:hypothetical protein